MLQTIVKLRTSVVTMVTQMYKDDTPRLQESRQRVRLLLSRVQDYGNQNHANCLQIVNITPTVENEEDVKDFVYMLFGKALHDDENPFIV